MDSKAGSASNPSQAPSSPSKARPRGPSQTNSGAKPNLTALETGEKKLSGVELKKQKQAEKAARRADKQGPPGQSAPGQGSNAAKTGPDGGLGAKKGNNLKTPTAPPTPGHKRSPSTQKGLPVRPMQTDKKPTPSKTPKQDGKKVALFGHLYGQPRNTTIMGAGKDIHPAVLALGLQMSSYVVCGSSARLVAMLLAFKRVIESYTTPPGNSLPRHLTSHLNAQIEYLVSCRPLATAMGNAIRWLKVEINDVDPDTDESQAKAELCNAIDRFLLERITAADAAIADTAGAKIVDGDVILTFGKSHIVQRTLLAAHAAGRRFRVTVVDARPLFEGQHLARALAAAGLDVTYALTPALGHVVRGATKVLLGAHAMLSNGRLTARAGTACVACMAAAHRVPVIVCCESVKFTDKVALDAIVANEVAPPDELVEKGSALEGWRDLPRLQLLNLMYDVTPAEYITMVVTEYGSLPPSSVPVVYALSTNT